MATKTISITEKAYNSLTRMKRKGESFSMLIERKFKKKGDLTPFIGAWKHIRDKEIEQMHKDIEKLRKDSGERLLQRTKF